MFQRHFTHEASAKFPQIYIYFFCSQVHLKMNLTLDLKQICVLRVDITDALASDKIQLVLWINLEL